MAVDAGTPGDALTEETIGEPDADDAPGTEPDDVGSPQPQADELDTSSSSLRLPVLAGTLIVVVLAGLTTYLGIRDYQTRQVDEQRNVLLQVARQGAVNLTTIDWQHADADVQRILASATGQFYDDFAQRSQPFVDVVKKVQSTSVGTVTEAGLESFSGNEAQALVAVSVTTTNPGAPEQAPRNWRMRVSVHEVGADAKVSNVEFVP